MKNFILLKRGTVFSPQLLGTRDILIAGQKIIAVEEEINLSSCGYLEIIDLEKQWVIPGLIDSHIHIAGAGGEGGPATRTSELNLNTIIAGGITTVIGCLGTDGITRTVESVLMKAKSLKHQGLSAWIYTGSYQVFPPTITGSVSKDIAVIEEVIGAGEIAIADHRSSYPTLNEFIKLIQEAKIGGLVGGKAGILNIHLGEDGPPFDLIYQAVARDGIRYKQFLPTHCNRSQEVFEAAKIYGQKGYVDITTSAYPFYPDSEIKPSNAFFELRNAGVPNEHITLSTDAGGSLPEFDKDGNLIKLTQGEPASLLNELLDIIADKKIKDEHQASMAIQIVTSNVSKILKLESKGHIVPGYDADLVVLNKERTGICHIFAKGILMGNNQRS
ncbi:MAG: beta-aspartyl-peptidase [Acidobacteria bacterium]|nr:beta-aspartyl-peptidase [Acidobacteriota bacterium]